MFPPPRNILVINLGQLGDVILSLPALKSLRDRFKDSKITLLTGKAVVQIIDITDFTDERIVVDRVKLRDSNKLWSVKEIFKLVIEIRRRNFDLVIDLHSFYETNLLGFCSGAKIRLFGNRENRSIDLLSNFNPPPPLEDKSKHLTERYLDILKPLGIENVAKNIKLLPKAKDLAMAKKMWQDLSLNNQVISIFPGAGNASRRWGIENFAKLFKLLKRTNQVVVFLGPEEADLQTQIREEFSVDVIIFDNLTIPQMLATLSMLKVLVSNDTGVAHLGSLTETNIVMIMDENAPNTYLPLTKTLKVINNGKLSAIEVQEVFQTVRKIL
jgi:heptosyltransferase II